MFFGGSVITGPCSTLKRVFRTVEDGSVAYGVVPVENSVEGSMSQTYDLLLQSLLKINGEVKIRVSHCLLALPGTKSDDIRRVYSHPQALAQCHAFLESLQVIVEPAYDTAGSAKLIKEKNLHDAAAIASERAASLYGLDILHRNIEDVPENHTRFFVIGKDDAERTGEDKTSVVFGTKHTPGSLHKALGELATRGINLTRIESRPIRGRPWEYHFFVDFEGHNANPSCSEALQALSKSATFLKILGSYPQADVQ
jgi:chorismate mutase/prephenate dehydratase